jgi:hypothetical protein
MFTDKDIIREEIRNNIKGHIYLCKKCNIEIFKTKYYAKNCTGYCKSCNAKVHLKKELEKLIDKKCISCEKILPISNFSFTGAGFYKKECTQCLNLKQAFNINSKDYNELLKTQKGKCAICKKEEKAFTKYGKKRNLAVDHCHKTGKIRGLLCTKCNTAIGSFEDNLELLNNAIKYLKYYDKN